MEEFDQVESDKANRKLQNIMKKQRLEREHLEEMETLFQHYATKDISVETVASHMGITKEHAADGLRWARQKLNTISKED
jgi:predicted DNA-binding protein (UPF0251 family)